jgi:hypothetical protein
MGLFDLFTSTRRPAAGVPVLSPDLVKNKLLAVNRPTAPYRVIDGAADGVDLVAEWKVVDAQWYGIFEKAGYKKTFRILLKLDPQRHEVRAQDREFEIEWSAGVPKLSFAGVVYNYRFNTKELKTPLQEAVTSSGWTYKGVLKL